MKVRILERIRKKAHKFNLKVEYLSNDTLKIHSEKYNFDSWLVKDVGDKIELWHSNKMNKCYYHLQSTFNRANWFWVLQRIDRHNKYVSTYLIRRQGNLVDRVMRDYREGSVKHG